MSEEKEDSSKQEKKDIEIEDSIDNNEQEVNLSKEKEEIDQNEDSNKKIRRNKIIGISVICILVVIFFIMNITTSKYSNIVYPGVSIYNQDISKLNEEELKDKLSQIIKRIDKNIISISINDKIHTLKVEDIVSGYNLNDLSNEIINYGKEENMLSKFYNIIIKSNKEYVIKANLNKAMLEKYIEDIADEVNQNPVEPKTVIDGENIKYIEGTQGIILEEDLLIKEIENQFKEDIYNNKIKIDAKYKSQSPKISIDELQKVNYKISSYSTKYGAGGGRGKNIEIAAKKIDDLILMPGDEFSYEKALGDINRANGYFNAPVIINGELKDGIGGGVCQVSSTLYNTQLKAGILPTERRNHSKAVSYVPRGLDATLATGSIDYKFKNTYKYPIVINTKASNGTLTIEFWSNENALDGIKYEAVGYARGNTANTYLYGYDKNGNKVYEKHIDTSIYR